MITHTLLRRVRVGAVALALVVGLVACNASAQDDSPGAESSVPSGAGAEEGALPVTIEHKYGSTTIEETPERIVTVGLKEQDDLLALGVVPIAATWWLDETPGGVYPWATDALGDADLPELLSSEEIEFEKITALEPDLIIGLYAGLTENDYATLSKIAPTVAQPGDVPDYGIGWQDELLTVGKAIGRPAAAQEVLDEVEQTVAELASEHPEFEGRAALFATPFEGIYVYGSADPRTRLLEDLGFDLPADIDEVVGTEEFGANLSDEKVDFVDVDALVWLTNVGKDKDKLVANKVYANLPVHQEGRDIYVGDAQYPEYGFSISFVTALSVPYTLERLVPQLSAAVDGNPATEVPDPPE